MSDLKETFRKTCSFFDFPQQLLSSSLLQISRASNSLCKSTIQPLLFSLSKGCLKTQKENQGHRVWTASGSGSHTCFLRLFFLIRLSFLGLVSPSVLQRSTSFPQDLVSAIFSPFHPQLVLFHCLFPFSLQTCVNLSVCK